ncbi:phosphate acetyltransferase, partial [Salmonella enterica subsp. enterica serovar Bareilly]|nr:phosphate acetyltransferase [Salmonella enterica subsp. enterica serovar Bareilly]
MLIERCRQQAKLNPPRVVLPDALDERVIHAARYLKQNGLAEPVLLANPFALRDFSLRTGVIMDGLSTIDPDSADEWRAEFADTITARLGEKAPEDADEAMRQPLWFGAA